MARRAQYALAGHLDAATLSFGQRRAAQPPTSVMLPAQAAAFGRHHHGLAALQIFTILRSFHISGRLLSFTRRYYWKVYDFAEFDISFHE